MRPPLTRHGSLCSVSPPGAVVLSAAAALTASPPSSAAEAGEEQPDLPPSLWTRTVSSGQSPNIRTVDKVEAGRVFFRVRVGSAAAAGRCCHEETSLIYTENGTQQPEDRLTEDEPTREQNRARSDGTCSAVHQPRK